MGLRDLSQRVVWDGPKPKGPQDHGYSTTPAAQSFLDDAHLTNPFINPHIWGGRPGDYIRAARAALSQMGIEDVREASRRLVSACSTLDWVLNANPGAVNFQYSKHGVKIIQGEIKEMLRKAA